jgi:hypothetical protein
LGNCAHKVPGIWPLVGSLLLRQDRNYANENEPNRHSIYRGSGLHGWPRCWRSELSFGLGSHATNLDSQLQSQPAERLSEQSRRGVVHRPIFLRCRGLLGHARSSIDLGGELERESLGDRALAQPVWRRRSLHGRQLHLDI